MASRHTRVCDQLGVTYPIFGFSRSADVVIAVCRAGGIDLVLSSGTPERNNREDIEAQLPADHLAFVDHRWERYDVPRDGLPGARSSFVRSEESARRQVEVPPVGSNSRRSYREEVGAGPRQQVALCCIQ